MRIYKLNDCDWWMANSLEEAVEMSIDQQGFTREEILKGEPRELTDAEMDKLIFVEGELGYSPVVQRTFRQELELRMKENPFPQLFATTEY